MKRGFVNSAIMLLLAFSVVIALFSFLLFENDMHNSAITGMIVEGARWYGDADNYYCKKTGKIAQTNPYALVVSTYYSRSGNKTTITYNDNELIHISATYTKNYPPHPLFIEPEHYKISGNPVFKWKACDVDGDSDIVYSLYHNTSTGWTLIDTTTNHYLIFNVSENPGPGVWIFNVTAEDQNGATGYDTIVRQVI
ncbi:MAG: hypothetical protein J7K68_03180 [Candidatus Diapherotrites archaeon]|nr:hypothetical protein [Candidatus Diapherotrites archaeon]